MNPGRALQAILVFALLGMGFSGVLAWRELCGAPGCSVAPGGTGLLLGMPVCVYGLAMYAAVAILAALGLRGERERMRELHA